ncbi:MAG: hypothetical protein GY726_03415 [Proteobacteria bacterium]|nr:hypothetical protein [Pseudomonadota bacterium]
MTYFLSHWRGELSLKLSLWVNTVGLLCVISIVELILLSRLAIDPAYLVSISLISLFVTRLLIYPWQLVGLFRAIDQDFVEHRNALKTRGLQAFAVLTVLFTLVYSLEVIQGTVFHKQQLEIYSRPPDRLNYEIKIDKGEKQLRINGTLDIGITKAVRDVLLANPGLSSVALQSPGGQVYQGRGLARLFSEYQLDTYVFGECSSACVTAYIGGKRRYLGENGKLGFHQYALEPILRGYRVIFYDPQLEQKRDMALYKSRGVKPEFLQLMFDQPASGIWFPDHQELLESNVVHAPGAGEENSR